MPKFIVSAWSAVATAQARNTKRRSNGAIFVEDERDWFMGISKAKSV
jgi:hypothetical protein